MHEGHLFNFFFICTNTSIQLGKNWLEQLDMHNVEDELLHYWATVFRRDYVVSSQGKRYPTVPLNFLLEMVPEL